MKKSDAVIDMCNKLVKNLYNMYSNRDENVENEMATMNLRIEEVLLENQINQRAMQVIKDKLLGEIADNILKTLAKKREDTYSEMHSIVKRFKEELDTEEQTRIGAMLEEQNEACKISTNKLDDIFHKTISNAISYLSQLGIPDDTLVEIKVRCGEIKNKAISEIEDNVSVYDEKIKQLIEETLEDINKLVGKEDKNHDTNSWELLPGAKEAFRKGEEEILSQDNAGGEPLNRPNTQDQLRADGIF